MTYFVKGIVIGSSNFSSMAYAPKASTQSTTPVRSAIGSKPYQGVPMPLPPPATPVGGNTVPSGPGLLGDVGVGGPSENFSSLPAINWYGGLGAIGWAVQVLTSPGMQEVLWGTPEERREHEIHTTR